MMKLIINSENYQYSHLEELCDKKLFKELLSEIEKSESHPDVRVENQAICGLYRCKAIAFLKGQDRALRIIDGVISKAKQLDCSLLLLDALLTKSELLRLNGDRVNAKKLIEEAELSLESDARDLNTALKILISSRFNLVSGNYFLHEGKYDDAIRHYDQSRNLLTANHIDILDTNIIEYPNKDKHLLASTYHNLGTAYNGKGEIKRYKFYLEKSIEMKKEINDTIGIATSQMGLGNVYRVMKEYEKAEKYFLHCLSIFDQVSFNRGKAYALSYLISINTEPSNPEANLEAASSYLKMFDDILMADRSDNIVKVHDQALANFLSIGTRFRDKTRAIDIYQKLIRDDRTEERMRMRCIISLCELYLEEYQVYYNSKILSEIVSLVDEVVNLAEQQNTPRWLIQALLLRSEIELLNLNYEKYIQIQQRIQDIADKTGMSEYKHIVKQRINPRTFDFFREMFNDTKEGLSKNHLMILLQIVKIGSCEQSNLREAMQMSRTTFFRAIKQLKELNLILIDRSLNDARKKMIKLDDPGKELMELFKIITSGKIAV